MINTIDIEDLNENLSERECPDKIPLSCATDHNSQNPFKNRYHKSLIPRFVFIQQKHSGIEHSSISPVPEVETPINGRRSRSESTGDFTKSTIEKADLLNPKSKSFNDSLTDINFSTYQNSLNKELAQSFDKLLNLGDLGLEFDYKRTVSLSPCHSSKKSLILDLDETLICNAGMARNYALNDDVKCDVGTVYQTNDDGSLTYITFYIRPYAIKLLKVLSLYYEIIVFTSAKKNYAEPIIDYLDPKKRYISYLLHRSHCTIIKTLITKDLRILNNRLAKNLVILDNSILSFATNIENGIYIPSYDGNPKDSELLKIIDFLIKIADVTDVRSYVKQFAGIKNLFEEFKKFK